MPTKVLRREREKRTINVKILKRMVNFAEESIPLACGGFHSGQRLQYTLWASDTCYGTGPPASLRLEDNYEDDRNGMCRSVWRRLKGTGRRRCLSAYRELLYTRR